MEQSAIWNEGALISYVPYFDKTLDAMTVALSVTYFTN